ncbi:MAG: M15 family metallopeptidase, partial [Patescibacteria group bacterium]
YILILLTVILSLLGWNPSPKQSTPAKPQTQSTQQKAPTTVSTINDPNNILVVVNKNRPLPNGYAPSDLSGNVRSEAKKHLDELVVGAKSSNINFKIISAYRSQSAQASIYNGYVKRDGQATADTYSARPRYSEHQTGLAIDLGNSDGVCDLEICFGDTPAGLWIKNNAHNYGFIVRYPSGKTSITGYQYEPWHLRYVGIDVAKSIHSSTSTLEEYSNLPPAPSY